MQRPISDATTMEGHTMAQTMLQYVFSPTPGADMPTLLGLIKESAEVWRKHGAQVSLWSVQVGEVGNMVFACRFDSTAELGATLDRVNADPAFATWRIKSIKAGLSTWVRSNQAYEITI